MIESEGDKTVRLPIDIRDFETIRREQYFYVDKTYFSKKCCVC